MSMSRFFLPRPDFASADAETCTVTAAPTRRIVRTLAALFAVCAVSGAVAVERTWVGASGGKWSDSNNWSPAAVPGGTDVVVFRPADNLVVRIGDGTPQAGGFRFESGVTTFAYTNSSVAIYMGNVSNFFDVAAGASVVVSNRFLGNGSLQKTGRFIKTGSGKLTICTPDIQDFWEYSGANALAGADFRGGETVLSAGHNYLLASIPINIYSGATVRCAGNYRIRTTQPVSIAAGGVLDCGAYTQYAQSISGNGVITNQSELILYLGKGACTFSGRVFQAPGSNSTISFKSRPAGMNDADWGFVIGAADTLARSGITVPAGAGNVVRFAAGITDFHIGYVGGSANSDQCLVLEDEAGCPVNVYARFYQKSNPVRLAGRGGAFFDCDGELLVSSSVVDGFSGVLGVRGEHWMAIGDQTAAGWPDLSPLGALEVTTGRLDVRSKNVVGAAVDVPLIGRNGRIDFHGDAVLGRANMTNAFWLVLTGASLTVTGGCTTVKNLSDGHGLYLYANSSLVLTNGARLVGREAIPLSPSGTALRRPGSFSFATGDTDDLKTASFSVSDGAYASFKSDKMPRRLTVGRGGEVCIGGNLSTKCTASDPAVMTVDGGRMTLGVHLAPYTMTVTPDSDAFELRVGAVGMHLDFDVPEQVLSSGHGKFTFSRGIKSGVADGTDGGVVRTGGGWMFMCAPHEITGTFDNRDGVLSLLNRKTVTDATAPMFGSGDFRLGNARLQYHEAITNSFTLRLATAAGKAVFFDGAATLCQRAGSQRPVQNIVIGPSGAATDGALIRGCAGAAFFLWNDLTAADPSAGGSVTVNGGLSADVVGRLLAPVFHYVYSPDAGTWRSECRHLGFLSCAADGTLTAFTEETEGFAGGAASVAAVSVETALTADAAVAALRVDGVSGLNAAGTSASALTIASGVTLSVGDGSHPAVVLMNNRDAQATATVKGAGTLDFGASEGLVAVNRVGSASAPARIDCTIAGRGGLSVVAPLDGSPHVLGLGGANTYTGGTRVNGAQVAPSSASAFSSGPVTLGDGDAAGGGLLMAVDGLVVPNDLRIAGRGPIGSLNATVTYGAVVFTADGELSGDAEIYAPVRLCAAGAARGTFSGILSGGAVEIWEGSGTVVFAGANTYTGGTEVVAATLALAGDGTAGTGDITLDRGILRIENTGAKTVAQKVSGVGTLALAGSGPVTFASLVPQDEGFILDVCGGVRTLAGSFAGIASVVNSSPTGRARLTAGTDGAWSGEIGSRVDLGVAAGATFRLGADATLPADARIHLEDGATLDLGGVARTIRTVYGDGDVVNGSLSETHPRTGLAILVK